MVNENSSDKHNLSFCATGLKICEKDLFVGLTRDNKTTEEENVCVYIWAYVYMYGHKDHIYQPYFSRELTCDRVMKDRVRRGGVSG